MPSIYVSTFRRYNNGSISGDWIDLADHTEETFFAKCQELHKDEADPELMFQDQEDIPKGMVSEASIKPTLWSWLELGEDDRELLDVYVSEIDVDGTLEEAQENFAGKFDSEEDWAAEFLESCGTLDHVPSALIQYFDYEAYARDARLNGDVTFVNRGSHDVWAFYNC